MNREDISQNGILDESNYEQFVSTSVNCFTLSLRCLYWDVEYEEIGRIGLDIRDNR